jgi:hypothetical protein
MLTEKTPKNNMKYYCENCNYISSNKKDYKRHLTTRKHFMLTNAYEKTPVIFVCNCGKEFKHKQSLHRHIQSCKNGVKKPLDIVDDYNQANTETIIEILKQNKELITNNQEFKALLVEQNKMMLEQQDENKKLQNKLIEAVKENCGNVNNTVNNNQKFNLNFFLNTTCKDAMNMSEFIENMEVNFKDIENIGKNGYVSGMTDMILSRIKELDVTKRPMHCTDLKRETMYIKDNDEWTKDTPENTKFHKMIDYVAKQNYAKMPVWRQRNPECMDSDHPKYDFCIKMMRNMLGDVGTEQIRLDNKVIKNLSRHIFVDKTVN